jgi:chondroitin 4-sulfotransferase 11
MIVDHEYRYLYIAVPKTGSISVQFSLGHGHDIPEPDLYHQDIHTALNSHPEAENYYKFGFVRNPWSRLLSLYQDFTKKRVYQYSALVRHETPLFSEFANFEDFCVRFSDTSWKDNIFLRSQAKLLGVHTDRSLMDYVGRFENLERDFAILCQILGLGDVQLQQHNAGQYDNSDYRQHYSTVAKDAIERAYSDDVKLFNYEF